MATVAEMKAVIAEKVDSDLAYIWADCDVDLVHQYRMTLKKITSLSRFASLEEDRERFKALMVKACSIDSEDEVVRAVTLADLVSAWEAARSMAKAELDQKAAASAAPSSSPAFIPVRTYNMMASSFKEAHGKRDDDELPGEPLMAGRVKMIEGNDPKAEPLEQVGSLEDGDEEITYAECGVTGVLKAHTRKVKKVPPPTTPERLRKTYKVLENSFLYAMRKHGNVWWLQDFTTGTFANLADYILGKKVMRLEAAADTNTAVPWSTLLKYEFQIRKRAMEHIRDDKLTLKQGLERAMHDSEIRALYFTTPLTLQKRGTKRTAEEDTKPWKPTKPNKEPKGKSKGDKGKSKSSKGSGKGKLGKSIKLGGLKCCGRTEDDRLICYAYNDGQCDGDCGMVHVCRVIGCADTHPMIEHPGFDLSKYKGRPGA